MSDYYTPPSPDFDDMSPDDLMRLWRQFKIFALVLIITGFIVLTLAVIKTL